MKPNTDMLILDEFMTRTLDDIVDQVKKLMFEDDVSEYQLAMMTEIPAKKLKEFLNRSNSGALTLSELSRIAFVFHRSVKIEFEVPNRKFDLNGHELK